MGYAVEQDIFIVKSQWNFERGEWIYSIPACKAEIRNTFPDFEVKKCCENISKM